MKATVHQLHNDTFSISGSDLNRIPEGVYTARYRAPHATFAAFGRGCLVLRFDITSGDYAGLTLEAFYNVKLIGKPGKTGKFSVTKRSSFFRDFVRGTGFEPDRLDRIPMIRLRGREFQVKVRTVTKDYERDELPESCQYSKITKLLSGTYIVS